MIKSIKISVVVLALVMTLSFASCAAPSDNNSKPETNLETQTQPAAENQETKKSEADGKDVLVVYFSATGTTKGVAEDIAKITNADIYEIVPGQKYTTADLDWNDQNSRTTKEQNDSSSRPKIAGQKLNLDSYNTIYIGYPIWWGEEPRIMDTFVESYDFSGKTVIPFCTSGGSGIGSSGANLEKNAKSGKWLEGERLDSSSDLESWVKKYK